MEGNWKQKITMVPKVVCCKFMPDKTGAMFWNGGSLTKLPLL
jgi:hypothetical protein